MYSACIIQQTLFIHYTPSLSVFPSMLHPGEVAASRGGGGGGGGGGGVGGMPERCRFWPNCRKADSCPFHHPSAQCRYNTDNTMFISYTLSSSIAMWLRDQCNGI